MVADSVGVSSAAPLDVFPLLELRGLVREEVSRDLGLHCFRHCSVVLQISMLLTRF